MVGNIAVLGSTGSVGTQTLQVVRDNPGAFKVCALTAHANVQLMISQAKEFAPEYIAMVDPAAADAVRKAVGPAITVESGAEAVCKAAVWPGMHSAVVAVVGFAALEPVVAAIQAGKHIALANKEALVAGGSLVKRLLKTSTSCLVPVDSEHSSIFQCILGRGSSAGLRRIIITASGGPFLYTTSEELGSVTPADAVKHPRWNMGAKISIDSATLMNKGLEVIEAAVLFNLDAERIEVLVHPESIVHGLAEYEDSTVLAALFPTDMRVPIAFALNYLRSDNPRTAPGAGALTSGAGYLDLAAKQQMQFFNPDVERFPALSLCYQALRAGGGMPLVLNAANEVAVQLFIAGKIGFLGIAALVARVMEQVVAEAPETIDDIRKLDARARECASKVSEHFASEIPSAYASRVL